MEGHAKDGGSTAGATVFQETLKLEKLKMANQTEKVARPLTPCSDLLDSMVGEVFAPVGFQKLAAAGVVVRDQDDLMAALEFGARIGQAADVAQASRTSPVRSHIQKVARALGVAPATDPAAGLDNEINTRIDANPALAQKMAAALG